MIAFLSSIRNIGIVVVSAWMLTFAVAYSDCSVGEFVRLECTGLTLGKTTASVINTSAPQQGILNRQGESPASSNVGTSASPLPEPTSAAAMKGQFGDFFGVLNALFGALTLLTVYAAYQAELGQSAATRNATNAQLQSTAHQRYLAEVDTAIQSYNRMLQAVDVPDRLNSERWQSVHGLFHLWKAFMTSGGVSDGGANAAARIYAGTYCHPTVASGSADAEVNLWTPIQHELADTQGHPDVQLWNSPEWVADQLDKLSDKTRSSFAEKIRQQWCRCYAVNRYQFDALFRAWYHVGITLQSAESLGVDTATEWRVAARFRAQLSSIELTMLLANQVLAGRDGYPKAVAVSARYAMFDNYVLGVDPVQHMLKRIANSQIDIPTAAALPASAFSSNDAKELLAAAHR